jgi:hypothetical protein
MPHISRFGDKNLLEMRIGWGLCVRKRDKCLCFYCVLKKRIKILLGIILIRPLWNKGFMEEFCRILNL